MYHCSTVSIPRKGKEIIYSQIKICGVSFTSRYLVGKGFLGFFSLVKGFRALKAPRLKLLWKPSFPNVTQNQRTESGFPQTDNYSFISESSDNILTISLLTSSYNTHHLERLNYFFHDMKNHPTAVSNCCSCCVIGQRNMLRGKHYRHPSTYTTWACRCPWLCRVRNMASLPQTQHAQFCCFDFQSWIAVAGCLIGQALFCCTTSEPPMVSDVLMITIAMQWKMSGINYD